MSDANGEAVSDVSLASSVVYTVTVLRSIPKASASMISVSKVSTQSSVTVTLPKNLQLSAPPMKGAFRIRCYNPDGVTSNDTADILLTATKP